MRVERLYLQEPAVPFMVAFDEGQPLAERDALACVLLTVHDSPVDRIMEHVRTWLLHVPSGLEDGLPVIRHAKVGMPPVSFLASYRLP